MSESFRFRDLFGFERLVAPRILKIGYWIGLVLITLWAIATLFGMPMMHRAKMADAGGAAFGLGRLVGVLIVYVLAVLGWRVLIEVYYVFFGIYTRLGEIRDRLGGGSA